MILRLPRDLRLPLVTVRIHSAAFARIERESSANRARPCDRPSPGQDRSSRPSCDRAKRSADAVIKQRAVGSLPKKYRMRVTSLRGPRQGRGCWRSRGRRRTVCGRIESEHLACTVSGPIDFVTVWEQRRTQGWKHRETAWKSRKVGREIDATGKIRGW